MKKGFLLLKPKQKEAPMAMTSETHAEENLPRDAKDVQKSCDLAKKQMTTETQASGGKGSMVAKEAASKVAGQDEIEFFSDEAEGFFIGSSRKGSRHSHFVNKKQRKAKQAKSKASSSSKLATAKSRIEDPEPDAKAKDASDSSDEWCDKTMRVWMFK